MVTPGLAFESQAQQQFFGPTNPSFSHVLQQTAGSSESQAQVSASVALQDFDVQSAIERFAAPAVTMGPTVTEYARSLASVASGASTVTSSRQEILPQATTAADSAEHETFLSAATPLSSSAFLARGDSNSDISSHEVFNQELDELIALLAGTQVRKSSSEQR